MPWPTHPDGSNKRIGDMTPDERAAVLAAARDRRAMDDAALRLRAAHDILAPLTRRGFNITIEIDDVDEIRDLAAEAGDAEFERRREQRWED